MSVLHLETSFLVMSPKTGSQVTKTPSGVEITNASYLFSATGNCEHQNLRLRANAGKTASCKGFKKETVSESCKII